MEISQWAKIWANLQGPIKGYVTARNLKLYLAAVWNLWFPWQKANDSSNSFDRRLSHVPSFSNSKLIDNNQFDESTGSTISQSTFLPNGDLYLTSKSCVRKINSEFSNLHLNRWNHIEKIRREQSIKRKFANLPNFKLKACSKSHQSSISPSANQRATTEYQHSYHQSISNNKKLKEIIKNRMSSRGSNPSHPKQANNRYQTKANLNKSDHFVQKSASRPKRADLNWSPLEIKSSVEEYSKEELHESLQSFWKKLKIVDSNPSEIEFEGIETPSLAFKTESNVLTVSPSQSESSLKNSSIVTFRKAFIKLDDNNEEPKYQE